MLFCNETLITKAGPAGPATAALAVPPAAAAASFVIRPAQQEDVTAIFDLVRQGLFSYAATVGLPPDRSGLPPLAGLQESPADTAAALLSHTVLVGCLGDQIAGTVRLDFSRSDAVLFERFAVAANWRRQGLARLLFAEAVRLGHLYGHKTLILHTAYGDFPALKFYEKLGFKILEISTKGPYPRAKMAYRLTDGPVG